MQRYSHVIWDWNGTLFDDAWLCREVVNGMLAARGKQALSEERYQEIFDFPVREYYRRAGFDFSVDPYEILANEFIEQYERRRGECRLRDGAREALGRISDAGIRQSILSAYPMHTLEDVVRSFDIRHYFTGLYGLDNHYAAGKKEIGKRMMAEAGYDPKQVILAGDTTHDFEVALALGVDCVLMPGGHHARGRLEQCGTKVVESIPDMLSAILHS